MIFSYEELKTIINIIESIQNDYKTKRQKEKIEIALLKYKYWKMVCKLNDKHDICIGGM